MKLINRIKNKLIGYDYIDLLLTKREKELHDLKYRILKNTKRN